MQEIRQRVYNAETCLHVEELKGKLHAEMEKELGVRAFRVIKVLSEAERITAEMVKLRE